MGLGLHEYALRNCALRYFRVSVSHESGVGAVHSKARAPLRKIRFSWPEVYDSTVIGTVA